MVPQDKHLSGVLEGIRYTDTVEMVSRPTTAAEPTEEPKQRVFIRYACGWTERGSETGVQMIQR